jgi:di/tricarboxylate transporter
MNYALRLFRSFEVTIDHLRKNIHIVACPMGVAGQVFCCFYALENLKVESVFNDWDMVFKYFKICLLTVVPIYALLTFPTRYSWIL